MTKNKTFERNKISGIELKNRIIRSATHDGIADDNGMPTDALLKRYEALAKGEVGAIITGLTGIRQDGKTSKMLMIDNDESIPVYKTLVDTVHNYGAAIIMQVAHCGRQTSSKITGLPTIAPSAIRDKMYKEDLPIEMTDAQIYEVIEDFVLAIERAKKAGFDGVQLHAAHGYLLSSFLSPHMNKRSDKWGGSTENRFRIIKEIFKSAREKVGDYPIWVKMNAYETSSDGIKLPESIEIAKLMEKAGCDAIEVSCGIGDEGFVTIRGQIPVNTLFESLPDLKKVPKLLKPLLKVVLKKILASPKPHNLYNLKNAEEIKKNVKIPVIVVGGIKSIDEINDIIENEKCDYVSMSRPFIIEADIVKKLMNGTQRESKCINCNCCIANAINEKPLKCYYGKC